MQTVVLDTNALLMPFEVGINLDLAVGEILGEVRFVVPGPLIGELKHLDSKHAKAALALARSREIVPTDARGDDAVIDIALKENGYILTNDKALRRRARTQRIPLLYLRSGTHLVEETYRAVGRLNPSLYGAFGYRPRDHPHPQAVVAGFDIL